MFSRKEFQLNPQQYVENLIKIAAADPHNAEALSDLAEAFFEVGEAQRALPLVEEVIRLDPKENRNHQMFFYAGQLYGGRTGLEYYNRALSILEPKYSELKTAADEVSESNGNPDRALCDQFEEVSLQNSQARLGMIEIWMTDLCMEPEAESECEKHIQEAFDVCKVDPEAWSVLASIRISQTRVEDAKAALQESWRLFAASIEDGKEDNSIIPKLIRLAQSMAEVMMIDEMLEVTDTLHRMDDLVPELYYLNAVAHKLSLGDGLTPLQSSQHICAARDAVEMLYSLDKNELNPEPVDPELLEAAKSILEELPEPAIANPWNEEDEGLVPAAN